MNFTFNEQKHELSVEEDGQLKRFILRDDMWEVIYLILKAIDKLDDGGSIVVDWARPDSTTKIPSEKLDTGVGPNQIVQLNDEGKIPGGLATLLSEDDRIILRGGTP